jgi:hypothetical protein
MEFSLQKGLMEEAGFSKVKQYYRLSELPLEDVNSEAGRRRQADHVRALSLNTHRGGFTSLVVAVK